MGVRPVFLMPWRGGDPWREQLFSFVRGYLREHFFWEDVFLGESPGGPFNRGAAINDAARKAGDWDVAVVLDADTIFDPWLLKVAICNTENPFRGCIFPFSTYMYLDDYSTKRLIEKQYARGEEQWAFLAPEYIQDDIGDGFRRTVRWHHASGVQVVHRKAYEAVGGFVELQGWGAEDEIMRVLFETFTPGVKWQSGGAYHLWHPAARNDPNDEDANQNHQILADVLALSVVPDQLKEYLQYGGHPIP